MFRRFQKNVLAVSREFGCGVTSRHVHDAAAATEVACDASEEAFG